jgi:hypothetical protein
MGFGGTSLGLRKLAVPAWSAGLRQPDQGW